MLINRSTIDIERNTGSRNGSGTLVLEVNSLSVRVKFSCVTRFKLNDECFSYKFYLGLDEPKEVIVLRCDKDLDEFFISDLGEALRGLK